MSITSEFNRTIARYKEINPYAGGRLRQMVKRYGIVGTIERLVTKRPISIGFVTMVRAGHGDWTFEAIVLRHMRRFSTKAIAMAWLKLRGRR